MLSGIGTTSSPNYYTTQGWVLDDIIASGPRFRHAKRVSASLPTSELRALISKHENTGIPLVIEGWHKHYAWPTRMFTPEWLINNAAHQTIRARNVHSRQDMEMPLSDFIERSVTISPTVIPGETERFYGKDYECPKEWAAWLESSDVFPETICQSGSENVLQHLPAKSEVETLMCYLGVGDTFTPCHKDLCASSGQNLMCYTSDDTSSSFWFMTAGYDASDVADYFQTLNQELDLESHVLTLDELRRAPFPVYVIQQKLGDLILVPPRSCHQVVNHGQVTIKSSWSRMTVRGLTTALYHELPIYHRVCRSETYRVKLTIYHAISYYARMIEDEKKEAEAFFAVPRNMSPDEQLRQYLNNNPDTKNYQEKLKILLVAYEEILAQEYLPGHANLPHVIHSSSNNSDDEVWEWHCVCDFCGADIFQSFFECVDCGLLGDGTASGIVLCPACYVEGRTCYCGGLEPTQLRRFSDLLQVRNKAIEGMRLFYNEEEYHGRDLVLWEERDVQDKPTLRLFESACVLYDWRIKVLEKYEILGKSIERRCTPRIKHEPISHSVELPGLLNCRKCHAARCFMHILRLGIHCSQAILWYSADDSHALWHEHHQSGLGDWERDERELKKAERRGYYYHLAPTMVRAAVRFVNCRPINEAWVLFGWYDGETQLSSASSKDRRLYLGTLHGGQTGEHRRFDQDSLRRRRHRRTGLKRIAPLTIRIPGLQERLAAEGPPQPVPSNLVPEAPLARSDPLFLGADSDDEIRIRPLEPPQRATSPLIKPENHEDGLPGSPIKVDEESPPKSVVNAVETVSVPSLVDVGIDHYAILDERVPITANNNQPTSPVASPRGSTHSEDAELGFKFIEHWNALKHATRSPSVEQPAQSSTDRVVSRLSAEIPFSNGRQEEATAASVDLNMPHLNTSVSRLSAEIVFSNGRQEDTTVANIDPKIPRLDTSVSLLPAEIPFSNGRQEDSTVANIDLNMPRLDTSSGVFMDYVLLPTLESVLHRYNKGKDKEDSSRAAPKRRILTPSSESSGIEFVDNALGDETSSDEAMSISDDSEPAPIRRVTPPKRGPIVTSQPLQAPVRPKLPTPPISTWTAPSLPKGLVFRKIGPPKHSPPVPSTSPPGRSARRRRRTRSPGNSPQNRPPTGNVPDAAPTASTSRWVAPPSNPRQGVQPTPDQAAASPWLSHIRKLNSSTSNSSTNPRFAPTPQGTGHLPESRVIPRAPLPASQPASTSKPTFGQMGSYAPTQGVAEKRKVNEATTSRPIPQPNFTNSAHPTNTTSKPASTLPPVPPAPSRSPWPPKPYVTLRSSSGAPPKFATPAQNALQSAHSRAPQPPLPSSSQSTSTRLTVPTTIPAAAEPLPAIFQTPADPTRDPRRRLAVSEPTRDPRRRLTVSDPPPTASSQQTSAPPQNPPPEKALPPTVREPPTAPVAMRIPRSASNSVAPAPAPPAASSQSAAEADREKEELRQRLRAIEEENEAMRRRLEELERAAERDRAEQQEAHRQTGEDLIAVGQAVEAANEEMRALVSEGIAGVIGDMGGVIIRGGIGMQRQIEWRRGDRSGAKQLSWNQRREDHRQEQRRGSSREDEQPRAGPSLARYPDVDEGEVYRGRRHSRSEDYYERRGSYGSGHSSSHSEDYDMHDGRFDAQAYDYRPRSLSRRRKPVREDDHSSQRAPPPAAQSEERQVAVVTPQTRFLRGRYERYDRGTLLGSHTLTRDQSNWPGAEEEGGEDGEVSELTTMPLEARLGRRQDSPGAHVQELPDEPGSAGGGGYDENGGYGRYGEKEGEEEEEAEAGPSQMKQSLLDRIFSAG